MEYNNPSGARVLMLNSYHLFISGVEHTVYYTYIHNAESVVSISSDLSTCGLVKNLL